MSWKKGPLPEDTYGWGGVVPFELKSWGFYFADFCGDHVDMQTGGEVRTLQPHEVAWYDNSLDLPPRHETTPAAGQRLA